MITPLERRFASALLAEARTKPPTYRLGDMPRCVRRNYMEMLLHMARVIDRPNVTARTLHMLLTRELLQVVLTPEGTPIALQAHPDAIEAWRAFGSGAVH